MSDFCLSDKIVVEHLIEKDTPKEMTLYYKQEDVKEFIKRLKDRISCDEKYCFCEHYIKLIDELAGDKLK